MSKPKYKINTFVFFLDNNGNGKTQYVNSFMLNYLNYVYQY